VKRVCVISDSHVNAITRGWGCIKSEHPDIELTFFASPKKSMNSLEVSSGRLITHDFQCARRITHTSTGLNAITGDYDCYLIVGLEFGFNLIVHFCELYRIEGEAADQRIPISNACFRSAIEDNLRNTISVETALKLHEITEAPIAVIPYPVRSRLGGAAPPWRIREAEIKKLADDAANRISEEIGFRLFLQPEQTLSSPLTTNPVYSRVPGAPDSHMNAAYGREILSIILDRSPAGVL
jgi:hypothetical protein